ncbi:hypothetical protein OS493_024290 [Desmophyllum pertusum]|uniref:Uncharacterized protein n=1 Tax=Desmophyllum pertusum TaxID=174260 RepID=A0A9W9YXZ1_9CNID|nr:hypothetical protein OS493_024290 [Desmophyllum pertusum]
MEKVNLHFHLGGDYKMQHVSSLWSLSFRWYDKNIWGRLAQRPCVSASPIVYNSSKDIIIDELHLMLRVTDRLEHGLG